MIAVSIMHGALLAGTPVCYCDPDTPGETEWREQNRMERETWEKTNAANAEKYCVTDSPPTRIGVCMFDDVDSCVKAARSLRQSRIMSGASCKPNRYYHPRETE